MDQSVVLDRGLTLVRYHTGETWLLAEDGGMLLRRVYSDSPDGLIWYAEGREIDRHSKPATDVPLRSIQF